MRLVNASKCRLSACALALLSERVLRVWRVCVGGVDPPSPPSFAGHSWRLMMNDRGNSSDLRPWPWFAEGVEGPTSAQSRHSLCVFSVTLEAPGRRRCAVHVRVRPHARRNADGLCSRSVVHRLRCVKCRGCMTGGKIWVVTKLIWAKCGSLTSYPIFPSILGMRCAKMCAHEPIQ